MIRPRSRLTLLASVLAAAAIAPHPAAAGPHLAVMQGDPDARTLLVDDRRVSLDEFLRAGGRGDLADRIVARRDLRIKLEVAGVALILVGAAVGVWGETCDSSKDVTGECIKRKSDMKAIGLGIAIAGAGTAAVGLTLSSRRPAPDDLRSIAWRANQGVTVAPAVGDHGGGLVVAGTF